MEIEIAGVAIVLQGLKLRRGLDGRMSVELPMFDARTASVSPASGSMTTLLAASLPPSSMRCA